MARRMRSLGGNVPLLVVAPWLSERTRELLEEQRVNYIDLTGNALVRLDNPPLYIQTQGAARNPRPAPRGPAQVKGAKAARLIRLLVDVKPPYGVSGLAEAAGLAPGYVSRLLTTLYEEALIERAPRGPVETVDFPRLLRRWANSYDIFNSNEASTFVARAGLEEAKAWLAEQTMGGAKIAVTGSVAAARLAPVAAPAQLLAYCDAPSTVATEAGLLPAEEGANAVLLRPFDAVVWARATRGERGLTYVAPSQAAVDCLTGNGRMPAEGEALIEWMMANESEWRAASLAEVAPGAFG